MPGVVDSVAPAATSSFSSIASPSSSLLTYLGPYPIPRPQPFLLLRVGSVGDAASLPIGSV